MNATRRVVARVNVGAIERNCARLREELKGRGDLKGGTELCVVVKADGYGHGAVMSARAALAGGASWLAVAGAAEARELREAGLREVPVLVMGALSEAELVEALAADADVVVWNERQVEAVRAAGGGRVHVKLDSGMGRLGTRDPVEASRVVAAARDVDEVQLVGLMTHFATADDLHDGGFFTAQLRAFADWAQEVKAGQPDLIVHAANSAGTLREAGGAQPELIVHAANSAAMLRESAAQLDMVRCGIAAYGMDPFGEDPSAQGLEPALELGSYVAELKECRAGESAGYGRRFIAERDTWLAVLPIGYGDGWRRGLSNNAEVLIGGRRYPVVGTVSMDNLTVDLGADAAAELFGAEAILIGAQGVERITAEEVAGRLGTINYEVTCGLTPRVPRSYHRDGELLLDPAGGSPGPETPSTAADRSIAQA
jgi:alanine racemase